VKIAVLGASGRTGLLVTRAAMDRSDEVTAVVRSPQRFEGLWSGGESPRVVAADARDEEALTEAFRGQDAVAFCLGSGRGDSHTIHRSAMQTCLAAMRATGVARIVALSASGMVVQGDDPISRYLAKPLVGRLLRDHFADLVAMEALLTGSALRWTVVRPPRLTNRRGDGRYRQRRDGNVRWGFFLSRSDLALSIVDALHDDTTVKVCVSVAG
jgi:putative NADH-flavin reductase